MSEHDRICDVVRWTTVPSNGESAGLEPLWMGPGGQSELPSVSLGRPLLWTTWELGVTALAAALVGPRLLPLRVKALSLPLRVKALSLPLRVKALSLPLRVKALPVPLRVKALRVKALPLPLQVKALPLPLRIRVGELRLAVSLGALVLACESGARQQWAPQKHCLQPARQVGWQGPA